jgi:RND family efflux transporter MFP subunit
MVYTGVDMQFSRAFIVIGCVVTALAGCSNKSSPPASQNERPPQKVKTVAAMGQDVTDFIDLVARMEASERVEIRPRVSGFLQKVHFEDGQLVNQDDLLFSIEQDEYQAVYNQSLAQVDVWQAKVRLAETLFARSKTLVDKNAISQEEYDEKEASLAEAIASLKAAQADAARTKLNLDYTTIRSPISGRIDRTMLDEGNFASAGSISSTVLTTVINDHPIRAVANIDESVRLRVARRIQELAGGKAEYMRPEKVSQLKVRCYLKLPDEQEFTREGIVSYVENRIDQRTGTSQIRGEYANEDGLLRDGMFARLRIIISEPHRATLVPDRAVGVDQASRFVYVVDQNNQVVQRPVEVGATYGAYRVVTGVEPGETVIVAGMQLVQPGMRVVAEADQDTAPLAAPAATPPVSTPGDNPQPATPDAQPPVNSIEAEVGA